MAEKQQKAKEEFTWKPKGEPVLVDRDSFLLTIQVQDSTEGYGSQLKLEKKAKNRDGTIRKISQVWIPMSELDSVIAAMQAAK